MTQLFKHSWRKISFQTDATINLQPSISAQSLTHPCLACLYFTQQHFKTVIMLKTPTKATSLSADDLIFYFNETITHTLSQHPPLPSYLWTNSYTLSSCSEDDASLLWFKALLSTYGPNLLSSLWGSCSINYPPFSLNIQPLTAYLLFPLSPEANLTLGLIR